MGRLRGLVSVVYALVCVVAVGGAAAQPLPKTPEQFQAEEERRAAREEAERKLKAAQEQARRERDRLESERAAAEARARRLQEELDRERKRAQEAAQAAKAAAAAAPAGPAVQPAAAPSARPAPGTVLKDCDVCPPLVVLPRGRFTMGSPASEPARSGDEGPQRVVSIDYDLAVGRYEVTQREWAAVMGSNPSHFKGCDDCPVENVSWNDAQAYLARLNQRTGGRFGYRLLSEAEWEYMARGVTRADAPSTAFWWGNAIDPSLANYDGSFAYNNGPTGQYRQKTTPVGTFKANPFGIHDVHGNVREWVQDVWHADYNGAPSDGSAWTVGGDQSLRVRRGGSWLHFPWYLRAAYRGRIAAGDSYRDLGVGLAALRAVQCYYGDAACNPGRYSNPDGLRIARTLP